MEIINQNSHTEYRLITSQIGAKLVNLQELSMKVSDSELS